MTEPLQPEDPGTLGRYRLVSRLGQGGMGTVFLGQDERGDRVAVKVINRELTGDPKFQDRFRREVAAARRVRRFCTAPVLDASLDAHPMYVVTEYIDGRSLEQVVMQDGPLRAADLENLAVGIVVALSAIHDAGIVHRDLKPANVLLSPVGPRVIDFGIARALDERSRITKAGQILGTPAYMAPELLNGHPVSPASDVFSWGCVVAFAGTGQDPFDGNTLPEIIHRVVHEPPWLHGLDGELLEIVAEALSKDHTARPTVPTLLERLAGRKRHDAVRLAGSAVPPSQSPERPKVSDGVRQPINGPPPPPIPKPPSPMQPTRRLPDTDHTTPLKLVGLVGLISGILAFTAFAALRFWPDNDSKGGDIGARQSGPAPTSPTTSKKPPETSQASTPPPDPGDVDRRFLGKWSGIVDYRSNLRKAKFPVTLTLTGGRAAQSIGGFEQPTEGCRGTLILLSATRSRLTVKEKYDRSSPGLCNGAADIVLTFRPSGTLSYSREFLDERGIATLRR